MWPFQTPPLAPPEASPLEEAVPIVLAVFVCWALPLILMWIASFPEKEPVSPAQTYVITGCSSGIGLDLVKTLAARGDTVYALVRTRASSKSRNDALSQVSGDVKIIEGIDVTSDGIGKKLSAALGATTIDVLINNSGIMGTSGSFPAQALQQIAMEDMRQTFEVNALGPLRVTKALAANLKSPGGKCVVINTGMGSIGDNGSGGMYAYRTSKAAANMITKSLAADLKKKGVAVAAIAPGFVVTEFGPGAEAMKKNGAAPVEQATKGILKTIGKMSLENTGTFTMVPTNGNAPKPYPW